VFTNYTIHCSCYYICFFLSSTDLKWLRCKPGTRVNLDALLYMTRAGFLGPLSDIALLDIIAKDFELQVGFLVGVEVPLVIFISIDIVIIVCSLFIFYEFF